MLVEWRRLGGARFRQPFFIQTVDEALRLDADDADDAERERMAAVTNLDAKNPQLPFARDPVAGGSAVTPALELAVDRWAWQVNEEVVAC